MKKTQNLFKIPLVVILLSISSSVLFSQSNTTVYPSGTVAPAPGPAPIPAVNATPGNTLFDDGASSRWESSPFLRSVDVGPFANSGTTPLFTDFNIFRVGENYAPSSVRMQLFGGNFVQTPSAVPFSTFVPTLGIRYNAIGDRVPFGATNAPGIRTTGLRSQWDQYAANFGLTDAATTGGQRNALISWQDATAANLNDVENRLVFGKRDQTTTNFEELATILANGNLGLGVETPLVKIHADGGNIATVTEGVLGSAQVGRRWNWMGDIIPFAGNPGIINTGLNSRWDLSTLLVGLTNDPFDPTIKSGLIAWQDHTTVNDGENSLIFGARDQTGTNFFERMRITWDGNVGIGINNPLIKLQVQDGNIGQTSAGDFGAIGTGNRWTAIGGRVPFGSANPLIRQEGIRTQWDRYGVGLGLTDRSGSSIKDAIITFQDANADFPNGTFSQNRFIIGARDSVGPGSDSNNVRKYLVIQGENGNTSIGINPPAPTSKLEVFGNGNSPATSALRVMDEDGNPLLFTRDDGFTGVITTSPIAPTGNFSLGGSPTPTTPGAGTIFFSVVENMTASGSLFVGQDVYATSDARMKKDFKELSEDEDWKSLLNITPYSYKFDQDKVDNIKVDERTRYGFKAQDVAKNIPELTKMWGDALVVNYQGFVPFLAAGIQEHENEIEQVKEENERISKENEDLKAQVKTLEEKLNDLYNLPAIQEAISQSKQSGSLDAQPKLYQNEPNPFGSKTTIRYYVPTTAKSAQIKVVDNSGAEMGSYKIQNGAGQLEITAGTIPAGNYNYSLYIDNQIIDTKKMVIVNY